MCSCHCMLCNRDGRVFNINAVYGNETVTIKEELLDMFGEQVKDYLQDSDVICAICETLLKTLVNIRDLWRNRIMYHPSCLANPKIRLKPICYGKILEAFNTELQNGEPLDDWTTRSSSSRSGSSSLLIPKRETEYDPVSEQILNEGYSVDGSSRPSSSFMADKEVEQTLKKGRGRRRKRERRKNGTESRNSRSSSTGTYSTSRSRSSKWDEVIFSSDRRTTRSASRIVAEEEAVQQSALEELFLVCDIEGCECNDNFPTLESLAQHKNERHKMHLLYACEECRTNYVCLDDYDAHINLKHDECCSQCLYCGLVFFSKTELVSHHDEHMKHSIKCLYCDRAFLYYSEYEKHRKTQHKEKAKKVRHRNSKKLILEKIDFVS